MYESSIPLVDNDGKRLKPTHTRTHARPHARTNARTNARTHTHKHQYLTHKKNKIS